MEKLAQARNALCGVAKHLPDDSIIVGSQRYTSEEVMAFFQSHLDALDAVEKAHAAFAQAVRTETQLAAQAKRVAAALKSRILSDHGPKPTVLGDFGWEAPKKTGPKTTKGKLAGVEKRREKSAAKRAALEGVEGGRRRRR
jgi:hypothetical protein